MSKGWETAIRTQENLAGWGSTTGINRAGHFLYVDSESLGKNAEIKTRDNKLIPMRLAPDTTHSLEQYSPGGDITFQPRSDDCLHILMAAFQQATFINGGTGVAQNGTWVFTPIDKSLSWSGVAFGTTSVYSINVEKYFGAGLLGTGDGIRFERGIVENLKITQGAQEDLMMTAALKFFQHTDEVVMGTGFKSAPNSLGSWSTKAQFVDWNGTISVGGSGTHPIEAINLEFDNGLTERRKLGQKGFFQFPFGRAVVSGDFELELEDMSYFKEGTAGGTISVNWYNSAGDFIQAFMPNVKFNAYDNTVSDTGPVMRTVPFRAYPTAFGGSNALVLSVCPKYGTGALGTVDRLVLTPIT